jgi:hypothetical protein
MYPPLAANVKLPRTSRGHRRHKPGPLALRKVTIKASPTRCLPGPVAAGPDTQGIRFLTPFLPHAYSRNRYG